MHELWVRASREPLPRRDSPPSHPCLYRQPSLTCGLNLGYGDRSAPSRDDELIACLEHGTGLARSFRLPCTKQLERGPVVLSPGSGGGIESTDLPYQRCCRTVPDEPGSLPIELGCVGCRGVVLRLRTSQTTREERQRLDQGRGTQIREPCGQRSRCFIGTDRDRDPVDHRAAVETFLH